MADKAFGRIYIGNQTAFSAPCLEPFEYAVHSGFGAFEWFPDKKPWGEGWNEEDISYHTRAQIKHTARAHGMRLSVHAPWQANPLDPGAGLILKKTLEFAQHIDASLLNIHLYTEAGIKAYVDAILPLVDTLMECGIQLALENTPLTAPEDFNASFTRLNKLSPHSAGQVGMCLDLGHANLCPSTRNDYLGFIDRLDPLTPINHIHLHENYGDRDSHLPLFTGPASESDAGVCGFVERIRTRNYSGSVILEQWPQPPSLLNRAHKRLKNALEE